MSDEPITVLAFTISVFVLALNNVLMIMGPLTQKFQYWPPPSTDSWQYKSMWGMARIGFIGLVILLVIETRKYSETEVSRGQIFGLIMFTAGMALTLVAGLSLGYKQTKGEAQYLKTTGLYGISRNPQYVGAFFWIIGLAVFAQSAQIRLILALAAFGYALCPFMEEPWLEQHFGQAYLDYKKRVPRFLFL